MEQQDRHPRRHPLVTRANLADEKLNAGSLSTVKSSRASESDASSMALLTSDP
jgi:hypothetical protein